MMTVGIGIKQAWKDPRHVSEEAKLADDGPVITIDQAQHAPEAFVQLYRLHYDRVFRYCDHRLFNRAAAEDVTSTVFLKVVQKFPNFRGDLPAFGNWLYKIATNTINTHLRDVAQRKKLLQYQADRIANCDTNCDSSVAEKAQRLAVMHQAMFTLKGRYQTVITLRYFENMKLSDVAEIVGSSPGTVRSQLKRALAQLRKRMIAIQKQTLSEVR